MSRNLLIGLIALALVGGCSAILIMNKQKIGEKSKLDGNLETIPVHVAEIRKTALSGDFEVNGSFTPFHEITLLSEGQGKVVDLPVNTGDVVQSGQVIAKLDDEIVKSQLALAEAALDKARADLKKYEGLLKADAISGQQVEDLRLGVKKSETDVTTLRKQLDFATIRAPFQGTVTRRIIEKGSLVMPGSPVADIVDVSRLKFIANLAESEIVQVKRGERVQVTTTLYPGVTYTGTVLSTGVRADEARRFPVEIEISNNSENPLKAGMFGIVRFSSGQTRDALMIPRGSVIGSIRTPKVYVVENDHALLRDIRIGTSNDHDVEVLAGLKEGEKVVTSGQINLDDNASVRIVNIK